MAIILEGTRLAKIKEIALKKKIEKIEDKISFLIVQIGSHETSEVYIKSKIKKSEKIGFLPILKNFSIEAKEEDIIAFIKEEQKKENIYGIIVEQPIPKKFNALKIIESISPFKDIDCLTPYALGRLCFNEVLFYPATPKAILDILSHYQIETLGKKVLIISRSIIIGKPLILMLLQKGNDATCICAHSKTENLKELTLLADIIITAVGKPDFLTPDMVKEESIIIDCGINIIDNKIIVGDASFASLINKVKAITPVPKGVGVLTTINLLENIFLAYERKRTI